MNYKSRKDESKRIGIYNYGIGLSGELDWFTFETKMRALVREIVNPVLNKNEEERERYTELEKKTSDLINRLEVVEYSCFNNRKNQKAPTMFELMFQKITELVITYKIIIYLGPRKKK